MKPGADRPTRAPVTNTVFFAQPYLPTTWDTGVALEKPDAWRSAVRSATDRGKVRARTTGL